jgi:hypothetical protein
MSNYGGLALLANCSRRLNTRLSQILKLLLGWGLALEDALVDEIRDVVHYVFAHPSLSRCAVRRRQFRCAAAASAIALVCWALRCAHAVRRRSPVPP